VKRIAIFFIFFLSYGALLVHSIVPHNHHEEEAEHANGHHHHDHHTHPENDQDEEGSLSLLMADVVHIPGSTDSYVSHTTSSFFKISVSSFIVDVSELSIPPPIVSSLKHPPSFREGRIQSFAVTNASLRAPPVA
jgi:Ca2+/H+ antiporter